MVQLGALRIIRLRYDFDLSYFERLSKSYLSHRAVPAPLHRNSSPPPQELAKSFGKTYDSPIRTSSRAHKRMISTVDYMCKAKSYVYVGGQNVQISTKSYVLKLTQELCASYCVRAITLQNKTLNPQPSTLNVSKLSIPQNNGIVLGIICKSTLLL